MAKAKASCQVVLTLSKDEAETLMDVVGSVNGDEENSRRKHTDAIYEELEIDGKEIELSEESYQNLKREICGRE